MTRHLFFGLRMRSFWERVQSLYLHVHLSTCCRPIHVHACSIKHVQAYTMETQSIACMYCTLAYITQLYYMHFITGQQLQKNIHELHKYDEGNAKHIEYNRNQALNTRVNVQRKTLSWVTMMVTKGIMKPSEALNVPTQYNTHMQI